MGLKGIYSVYAKYDDVNEVYYYRTVEREVEKPREKHDATTFLATSSQVARPLPVSHQTQTYISKNRDTPSLLHQSI